MPSKAHYGLCKMNHNQINGENGFQYLFGRHHGSEPKMFLPTEIDVQLIELARSRSSHSTDAQIRSNGKINLPLTFKLQENTLRTDWLSGVERFCGGELTVLTVRLHIPLHFGRFRADSLISFGQYTCCLSSRYLFMSAMGVNELQLLTSCAFCLSSMCLNTFLKFKKRLRQGKRCPACGGWMALAFVCPQLGELISMHACIWISLQVSLCN